MDQRQTVIKPLYFLVVFLSLIYLGAIPVSSVKATTAITRYVDATTGTDTGSCSFATTPCHAIQYAINKSASGDTILVAKGIYTYSTDWCSAHTSIKPDSVICYVDKSLTILGGYSSTDWSTANPTTNLTVIDGQNSHRGVDWVGFNDKTHIYLDMEGFTIQNGLAQGPTNGYSSGIGGGMLVQYVTIILRDMVFKNNQSIGQTKNTGAGGQADGGGIRIESAPRNGSLLQRVVFDNNQSHGGTGGDRGGVALGALFIFNSTVTVEDATFTNNLAQGGSSTGNGTNGKLNADALGGAIGIENAGTVILRRITMTGNQVIGGNATQNAGGAYGGAILVEDTDLFSISDAYLANNSAVAGTASTGGNAAGGAINTTNSGEVTFERVQVINNTATGGKASSSGGNAGTGAGGGFYVFATKTGTFHATINNAFIADNQAYQGSVGVTSLGNGGGGGVIVQGMKADINHATIARNHIGSNLVLGQGMVAEAWASLPATVNLNFSIIADHTGGNTSAAAIVVDNKSALTLTRGLFVSNTRDTNNDNMPITHGTINGLSSMLYSSTAGFVSPGSPNYDYHILTTSAAKDQAINSTMPEDIDDQARPYGPASDIGADEYELPYLSAIPNSFSEMLDDNGQVSRSSSISVSSGPSVSWTAITTATWLYLGPSGTSKQSTGQTGDNLIIRFAPGAVGLGSYDSTVQISSTSAISTAISIHLEKVNNIYAISVPLILKP